MDVASLRSLHETENGRLKKFFQRRLRNNEDASDAMQETFLRVLYASRSTLIENPQAYLYQVAKNVANRTLGRAAKDAGLFLSFDVSELHIADDAPCQERIVSGRQCLLLLAQAIAELPNRCQQVFILSRLHGMPNGEIAAELGITRNMVEKHIIKALLHCRNVRLKINS